VQHQFYVDKKIMMTYDNVTPTSPPVIAQIQPKHRTSRKIAWGWLVKSETLPCQALQKEENIA
jgi:hypothetical protein